MAQMLPPPSPIHRPDVVSPTLYQRRLRLANGALEAARSVSPIGRIESALDPVGVLGVAERDLPRLVEPLLERTRLLARLNSWAPVTVLAGLRGSGKTTLVTSWLASQSRFDVTSLWLGGSTGDGVDTDNSAADFETELAIVLDRAGIARTAAGPIARLHDSLLARPGNDKVVLVIDGFDRFDSGFGAAARRALVPLVQRHRHFHLVVCSRRTNPFAGAAAVVDTTTLGDSDLRFDARDIETLADGFGLVLGNADVRQLQTLTSGWPALVRMVLQAQANGARELAPEVTASFVRAAIRDATGRPGDPDRDLLRFALADYIDSRLIADVCGSKAAPQIVERLTSSGLVEGRQRGDAFVLHYPSVVREVLRAACVDVDPEAARRFHGRLAAWFAHGDRPEHAMSALRHAVAARDWVLAGQVWNRRGVHLVSEHRDRLRTVVRDIPPDALDGHPGLALTADVLASSAQRPREVRASYLRLIERCRRQTNDQLAAMPLADLLYCAALKLIGLRSYRDGGPAAAAAARAESGALIDRVRIEMATGKDASAGDGLVERIAWFEFEVGRTEALAGRRRQALRHYQSALEHAASCATDVIVAAAGAHLALEHAVAGRLELATQSLAIYADACTGPNSGAADLAAQVATGLIALDRLDRPGVELALEALEVTPTGHELWAYIAFLHGQYGLHFAEPAATLTRLAAVVSANLGADAPTGIAADLLARARADLLMSLGQGQRAQNVLAGVGRNAPIEVARARLFLQSGDREQARLRAVRTAFDDSTGPRDQLELLLISAVAALRAGDLDDAGRRFRQTLDCAADSGIARVFATIDPDDLLALGRLASADPAALGRRIQQTRVGRAPIYGQPLVLISLTKSELALIEALGRTTSRREIAETRYVSLNTIKTQLRALYQKLGTTSREDTLARIRELGLLA